VKPFLIVDTETTGLDPKTDRLVEVAAVLFDPDVGAVVDCCSALVVGEGNAAEDINRVPAQLLQGPWCVRPQEIGEWFEGRTGPIKDDVIYLAHNAAFDRGFLPSIGEQWVCTKTEAEWPRMPGGTGSLIAIALAYDVGVVRAHRAIEDCLTLAALLARVHELEGGLSDWLARAQEPRERVIAQVSYDGRQKAKDAGFQWDGDRKQWWRSVRASQVGTFTAALSFHTRVVR
jgi:DNA polymerase-3 subunit epsilon